ncbi:hypothetical protein [Alloyangia pacifica]|uniref:hypothetical protein n=1 Tax=Alloyangia pacifica TaxID=311180 RepID=UPI0031CF7F62
MAHIGKLSQPTSETTDLERRVLAHERVLQALIAYLARSDPRFIDDLWQRFVTPMKLARREHDYRDTNDYAEEFIRAVTLLEEKCLPQPQAHPVVDEQLGSPGTLGTNRVSTSRPAQSNRIEVLARSGIWEVRADGKFRGHYLKKEHAVAAAALLKRASS